MSTDLPSPGTSSREPLSVWPGDATAVSQPEASRPDARHPDAPPADQLQEEAPPTEQQTGHARHRLMMIACCIPMLLIVGLLLVTGVAGSAAVVFALVCIGLMGAMMFLMPGGHRH